MIKLFEMLCDAFAQLSEAHVVSDVAMGPITAKFVQQMMKNEHVWNVLVKSDDADVTARLRFAGACTQVVSARFYSEQTYSQRYVYPHNHELLLKMDCYSTRLVCEMAKRMPRVRVVLTDSAYLKTLDVFECVKQHYGHREFSCIKPETKYLSIYEMLEAWNSWKAIDFPEVHLEWIVCLALIIVQEDTFYLKDPSNLNPTMETFYVDLPCVITRSLHCGVFALSSECMRIVMKMVVVISKAVCRDSAR